MVIQLLTSVVCVMLTQIMIVLKIVQVLGEVIQFMINVVLVIMTQRMIVLKIVQVFGVVT